jgi:hypothetical protein
VTEAEWLACEDAGEMLRCLLNEHSANRSKCGRRRLRLFGCASCRLFCDAETDPRSLAAIEHTERFTDGEVGAAKMAKVEKAAHRALLDIEFRRRPEGIKRTEVPGLLAARAASTLVAKQGKRADWCAYAVFRSSPNLANLPFLTPDPVEQRKLADQLRLMSQLLRDIVGNPFHPIALKPSWRTSNVVALARGVYDDRAFDHLPILADALEEAGCTDQTILDHLRGPGPHVRGCWILDAVLGKS